MNRGKLEQAEACYRKALETLPGHPMVLSNIGNALQQQGDSAASIAWFEKAISIDPGYVDAHNNLGNALQDMEMLGEAVAAYKKAISLNPNQAELHANLGLALKKKGDYQQSVDSLETAVRIKPDYSEAYNNLANALNDMGLEDRADYNYRKALDINPRYAEAYRHLSALHKFDSSDTLLSSMKSLYVLDRTSDEDRMHLCFALAKAYEDLGEYHQGFEYLREGNDLRNRELAYDLGNDRRLFETLKTVFHAGRPGCTRSTSAYRPSARSPTPPSSRPSAPSRRRVSSSTGSRARPIASRRG